MNTFYLKVISSDKVFYEGRCEYLIIPTPEGQKGVLAHHENMVVAVEIGELHLRTDKGEWITAAVSKGFAEIMNNRVSVLVNSRSARKKSTSSGQRKPRKGPRNDCARSRASRSTIFPRHHWPGL